MVASGRVIDMGMSSVSGIAKAYLSTLRDQRTGDTSRKVVIAQFGIPIFSGVAWALAGPAITAPGNAIVGISIVSALLCAMATMLFQTRVSLDNRKKGGEETFVTEVDLILVDQLFSAVLWAILLGFLIVLAMVTLEWFGAFWLEGASAQIIAGFLVAFTAHFVFVVGTILKRLNRVYEIVARNKR